MREAGVNLVSLGIFTWALLEPAEGSTSSAGSTAILDLLHAGGHRGRPGHPDRRAAGLVLPRATREPLPVNREGVRARRRRAARRSAPARPSTGGAARGIAEQLAERYARPPRRGACGTCTTSTARHSAQCYCDGSARGVPRLAARPLRRPRRAQRRLGHHVLGPALRRLGRDRRRRGARRTVGQPGPAARLRALLLRRAPRPASAASATSCAGCTPACR